MSGVVYEPYPAFDTRQVLVTVHYRRRSVTETVPGTTTARQQLDSWRARLSVRRRVVRLYDEHGLPIDLDAPLAKVAGGREWIALALGEPKEGLAAQSSRPPGMGPITHGERLVALSIQASSRAVEADRWIEELLAVAALVVVAVAAGTVGVVELAALLAGHPGPSLTAAALWHGLVGWHHHLGDPKNAFPAALRKVLPGPVVMYFAVAVVGVVVVGLAVAILTFFVRSAGWRVDDRTARRRGLGPDRAVGRQFPKQPGTVYFARTAQSGGALYLGADRSLGAVLGPGTGKSVAALGWIIDTPGPVRATSTKLEFVGRHRPGTDGTYRTAGPAVRPGPHRRYHGGRGVAGALVADRGLQGPRHRGAPGGGVDGRRRAVLDRWERPVLQAGRRPGPPASSTRLRIGPGRYHRTAGLGPRSRQRRVGRHPGTLRRCGRLAGRSAPPGGQPR